MDEPDEAILICLPTNGVPKAPIAGGVKRVCCRCRQQVWLAPTGMRIQRERGASLLCIPCWLADRECSKQVEMTPEQLKEIAATLRETDRS